MLLTLLRGTCSQLLGFSVPVLKRISYFLLLEWALNLQEMKLKSPNKTKTKATSPPKKQTKPKQNVIVPIEAHKCLHVNIKDKTAKIKGARTYLGFYKYLA